MQSREYAKDGEDGKERGAIIAWLKKYGQWSPFCLQRFLVEEPFRQHGHYYVAETK